MNVLVMFSAVFAQSNIWPSSFSFSDSSHADSIRQSSTQMSNEITVGELVKSKNSISTYQNNKSNIVEQHLDYFFSNYDNGILDNYVDLSGKYLRKNPFSWNGDVGLDWTPGLKYQSDSSGLFQIPVDIGPVTDFRIANVPVTIRSGFSGYGCNNNIRTRSDWVSGNYHKQTGYYGNFNIGDTVNKWFRLPVIANVNALGKSLGGTAIGVVKSYLKSGLGFTSGDSLFVALSDTFSNGKELAQDYSSKPLYSNNPWKIEHNLSVTGALKYRNLYLMRPGIIYSYNVSSVRYPSNPKLLDVRTRRNNVVFQIGTDDNVVLEYKGGLSLGWENSDWLYDEKESAIAADSQKQSANLEDCKTFSAITDNDLLLHLPKGFAINYQLHATRDSKEFPFTFMIRDSLHRNERDNDQVRILQHGGLLFEKEQRLFVNTYGELTKCFSYYYCKENSGSSYISDNWHLGTDIELNIWDLLFGEYASAEAERSDYKFKEVHMGNTFSPPPYFRKVSSLFVVTWLLNKNWTITGKWNETYNDIGNWFSTAYSDSIVHIDKDYYGIYRKTTDYSLQLITAYLSEKYHVNGGILFRDSYQRDYEDAEYVVKDFGTGYTLEPSTEFSYIGNRIRITSKIIRKINTLDKDKWKFSKNWDVSLTVNTIF